MIGRTCTTSTLVYGIILFLRLRLRCISFNTIVSSIGPRRETSSSTESSVDLLESVVRISCKTESALLGKATLFPRTLRSRRSLRNDGCSNVLNECGSSHNFIDRALDRHSFGKFENDPRVSLPFPAFSSKGRGEGRERNRLTTANARRARANVRRRNGKNDVACRCRG